LQQQQQQQQQAAAATAAAISSVSKLDSALMPTGKPTGMLSQVQYARIEPQSKLTMAIASLEKLLFGRLVISSF
jgi:hypothetical protein